jgi:hypothetical protein
MNKILAACLLAAADVLRRTFPSGTGNLKGNEILTGYIDLFFAAIPQSVRRAAIVRVLSPVRHPTVIATLLLLPEDVNVACFCIHSLTATRAGLWMCSAFVKHSGAHQARSCRRLYS